MSLLLLLFLPPPSLSVQVLVWKNYVLPLKSQSSWELHYSSSKGGLQPASPLWSLSNRLQTYCQSTLLSVTWVSVKPQDHAGWNERTYGPHAGSAWASCRECFGLLCLHDVVIPWRHSLQPCLQDFEVTKPHWAQHLAALHLAQYQVFQTFTPRERGEGVCPSAWNDPFCQWCICNMVSLKSSPKFRVTPQTPIITQSYYWEKIFMLPVSDSFCHWAEQNGPHTPYAWSVLFCEQFLPSHYHGLTTGCQRALPG